MPGSCAELEPCHTSPKLPHLSASPIYHNFRPFRLCTIFARSTAFISDFSFSFSALHSKASFSVFSIPPPRPSTKGMAQHLYKNAHTNHVSHHKSYSESRSSAQQHHGRCTGLWRKWYVGLNILSFPTFFSHAVGDDGFLRLKLEEIVSGELRWWQVSIRTFRFMVYGLLASKEVEWTAWLMVFRVHSGSDLEETAVVMYICRCSLQSWFLFTCFWPKNHFSPRA